MSKGKVWLVGAGPGDPGLLTVKGRAVLKSADVVVYDALVGPGILALIPQGAEGIDVGKRSGEHPVPQERINEILLEQASLGRRVVRLKGGDPFVFGRGGEELELLNAHHIPFEIAPGITSAVAAAAYAGIPVTHREFVSGVYIVTGHAKRGSKESPDYSTLARIGQSSTLVFLMGVSALESICRGLLGAGMPGDTPAAVVENGTTAGERRVVSTLGELPVQAAAASIVSPAVILVGQVCALAERFHWSEDRPLGQTRVFLTRPREGLSRLRELLEEQGAEVVELPCIRTQALLPNSELQDALGHLGDYDGLVFTSPAGVSHFMEYLESANLDVRALGPIPIAAVGEGTARQLRRFGLRAAIISHGDGAALGQTMGNAGFCRVLLLRARDASPNLPRELMRLGTEYRDIPLYETRPVENSQIPRSVFTGAEGEAVLFTSASSVQAFARWAGEIPPNTLSVCIGPETAAAARAVRLSPQTAATPSLEGMVARLMELRGGTM